jgi:hypothetical protein
MQRLAVDADALAALELLAELSDAAVDGDSPVRYPAFDCSPRADARVSE